MALADEVYQSQHYKEKEKKKKKSFSEAFIPHKGDSGKEIAGKIFSLFAIVVLIACIAVLAVYFYHQFEAKQNNNKLNVIYNNASSSSAGKNDTADSVLPSDNIEEVPEEQRPPLAKSEAAEEMLAINPDYVGYVYIPDVFGEPVVQRDDSYYLKHNFYDQVRSVGTVFADPRNVINDYSDKQSDNIILYGHNQRDGTMFGTLNYYKVKPSSGSTKGFDFYVNHPTFEFSNLYEEYTYKIIAAFVIEVEPRHTRDGIIFDYHNYINFAKNRPFDSFKENILERTAINTGVDFDENDKFLTLSTCSNEFEPSRFVVIGRRVRDGESAEVDTTLASVNYEAKEPDYSFIYNQ